VPVGEGNPSTGEVFDQSAEIAPANSEHCSSICIRKLSGSRSLKWFNGCESVTLAGFILFDFASFPIVLRHARKDHSER